VSEGECVRERERGWVRDRERGGLEKKTEREGEIKVGLE